MKKFMTAIFALALSLSLVTGCGSQEPASESAAPNQENQDSGESIAEDNPMSYVTDEELKDSIDSYVILDVRKAEDYNTSHITSAYSADVDAAREGDNESGIENLSAALKEATGSETGDGSDIVLVCYSGKAYAQKATDLLIHMGVDSGNIYTLEGGFNGWSEAGDEYTALIEQ